MAWKVQKDYLESEGHLVRSPRATIKQSYQDGLIEDGHTWMDALDKRNSTTHTYDEVLAEKLVNEIIQRFLPAFKQLYITLREKL
ncbi:nucleotidyltransferase substrate binding protein [Halobacillus amylolyticus]|uniref:Nucleotidyltransferase substrate binding protein n=1 Tax=Halobacillus amylolyticus TaxID=2932259 RepID=A0ABY4H9J6_9BACI|nr:nucleotidyltransferase substrate binding protein [Halobacillus amylolyticus]